MGDFIYNALSNVLFPILFAAVVLYFFVYRVVMRKRKDFVKDMRVTEREANSARRKEIDPSLFFTVDASALPEFDTGNKHAAKAASLSQTHMVHFSRPVSNVELKMSYGPGQLEIIAQYEENYQLFIRLLINWAEDCIAQGQKKEALQILEYTVSMNSEYRKSYLLAADLYRENNNETQLLNLRDTVQSRLFRDTHVQHTILNYINSLLEAFPR
jgi:hypothetical protein